MVREAADWSRYGTCRGRGAARPSAAGHETSQRDSSRVVGGECVTGNKVK